MERSQEAHIAGTHVALCVLLGATIQQQPHDVEAAALRGNMQRTLLILRAAANGTTQSTVVSALTRKV